MPFLGKSSTQNAIFEGYVSFVESSQVTVFFLHYLQVFGRGFFPERLLLVFTFRQRRWVDDWQETVRKPQLKHLHVTGSTIRTLLNGKINLLTGSKSLGDVGFLLFFRIVSGDYGKP